MLTCETQEKARLAALKEAVRIGFLNIEEGRFQDVCDDRLEEFIGELGRQASVRARNASR